MFNRRSAPVESRNNCGGCHAHSQQPTLFEKAAAARAETPINNLQRGTLTVSVRDKQGNVTRIARVISVGGAKQDRPTSR